jgi:predicted porin
LPSRQPTVAPPPIFVGPNLFNPPAPQGWLTLTPTFTLGMAYNDNVDLTSDDKHSDFILGLTPGVTVAIQRPGFRLLGGYQVSGEVYLDETDRSDFGKEQNFFADLFYQVSPSVTFTLSDQFVYSRDSNSITSGGVSVGFQDAFRNTLAPRLRWQATQTTGVSLAASYTLIRFTGGGEGDSADESEQDSDTYRLSLGADRRLTPRLNGIVNFEVAHFDFERESSGWTYTPTVGIGYDVTRTLRASVTGGATILDRDGDTTVSPAWRVALTQAFKFGSFQFGYDRSVVAETIGLSDRQAIFASLSIPTLLRGLRLDFTPRYIIADTDVSDTSSGNEDRKEKTLTLSLQATYQIARNISLIGSYTFFRQTSNREGDIDQNRVFLGVQYAFPINFY